MLLAAWPARAAASPRRAVAAARVDVVFDLSLDQMSSPFDASFEGESRLAALLRRHGATVSTNVRPLEEVLPQWAGPGRVLVLGIPWRLAYPAGALAAIDAFLRAGGGVLAIVEHDDAYGSSTRQNALLERYGIRALPGEANEMAREGAVPKVFWPLVAAPRWGIEGARMFLAAPLEVRPPAEPVVRVMHPADPAFAVVGAQAKVGPGRLVVLGDVEMLWNMTPDSGVRDRANPRLLLRVFGELAGLGRALARVPWPPAPPPGLAAGRRCAIFESGGFATVPGPAPAGILGLARALNERGFRIAVSRGRADDPRCELAVVVAPLEAFAPSPAVRAAPRLLVVGDGGSDLLGSSPVPWRQLPVTYAADADTRPLDALLAPLGLRVEPVTLVDEATDQSLVTGEIAGVPMRLHRSAALAWRGEAFTVVARAAPAARPVRETIPPLLGTEPGAELPRRVPVGPAGAWPADSAPGTAPAASPPSPVPSGAAAAGVPVVARSARVFAIADLEAVADQEIGSPAGQRLLAAIDAWLASGDPVRR